MTNIIGDDYNNILIKILSNIADSLSNDNIIDQIGVPLIVALFTTLLTIWLTSIHEKKKEKKIKYISSIKLFKDLNQSIIYLQDDMYSNIEFLTFLNQNKQIIEELYSAQSHVINYPNNKEALDYILQNQLTLERHNSFLKTITIIQNKLTIYENEYSNLLYDISDLLTTEEINALIQHYNNIILLDNVKTNVTKPGVQPEESKFYLLDTLKVYEGNQYSIINDKHLKSCYEKLYKSSGYNKIDSFEKIKFDEIIK